jgi:thiamine biosynthesis lipoprotein
MPSRAVRPGNLVSNLASRIRTVLGKRAVERIDLLMGTVVTQKVYGWHAAEASNRVLDELLRLERLLSAFLPESDVSRVNASAGLGPTVVSPETFEIFETGGRISEMSQGAFDITTGPLTRLWSVTADSPRVPPHEAIKGALGLVGYHHVRLDRGRLTCFLPAKGQAIDLGGIAKGYAADRAVQIYRELGVKSALIDIGGNVSAVGGRPGGEPWVIGVQDPRAKRGDIIGTLNLKDASAVTSGGYERGFSADGVWYDHIIDPRSGYPSRSDVAGVTVVADQSIVADALSTAVFVLGSEQGMGLVEQSGTQAVVVKNDGSVMVTEGLRPRFSFVAS